MTSCTRSFVEDNFQLWDPFKKLNWIWNFWNTFNVILNLFSIMTEWMSMLPMDFIFCDVKTEFLICFVFLIITTSIQNWKICYKIYHFILNCKFISVQTYNITVVKRLNVQSGTYNTTWRVPLLTWFSAWKQKYMCRKEYSSNPSIL